MSVWWAGPPAGVLAGGCLRRQPDRLLVTSAAGRTEIVVRYSGCDHNGFDDGVAVRSLTAEAIAAFITGPNQVLEFSGSQKMPILQSSVR